MDDLQRMLAEHACQKLVAKYFRHINPLDLDAVMDLFSESAVIVRGGLNPLNLEGRAAIRAYLDAPHEDFKLYAGINAIVDVIDGNTATGSCQALVIEAGKHGAVGAPPGRLLRVLWYEDAYEKGDTGWRIARREVGRLIDNSGA
jgi:ketosteroid isomerase-like protein